MRYMLKFRVITPDLDRRTVKEAPWPVAAISRRALPAFSGFYEVAVSEARLVEGVGSRRAVAGKLDVPRSRYAEVTALG